MVKRLVTWWRVVRLKAGGGAAQVLAWEPLCFVPEGERRAAKK
ncbi:MAG: hypothetical protein RBS40_06085 [Rhodocyclaceae bacterium]|jgi:hypothetical protein|nr:hypothetical protein [Rhodocyclaceae bacterium]